MDGDELIYEQDLIIDPNQLDVEAVRQAELFYRYAKEAVKARTVMDEKKMAMEVLEAKLQMRVRENPEKFGLLKVTEASIIACVKTRDSYIGAFQEWVRAAERSRLIDKAVVGMEMKKSMIETLTKLHGQQYFAGPSVPHNLVEAWQDHQKRSNERVNQKQVETARRRAKRGD